jgi:hypothetical protein
MASSTASCDSGAEITSQPPPSLRRSSAPASSHQRHQLVFGGLFAVDDDLALRSNIQETLPLLAQISALFREDVANVADRCDYDCR